MLGSSDDNLTDSCLPIYLAAGAFNILDSDKDGVIDEEESSSGLYLFG
jgi:hypothetical protein